MCHVYSGIAASACLPVTRSVRLNRVVTSIRLEASFWAILDRMAAAEGVSTPRFLSTLFDEVMELQGEVGNFASLLRVACTVFLEREQAGKAQRRPMAGEAALAHA